MAWSAPFTAVANTVYTAAQFNQFVRDNLNETAPAKATSAGSHFVADGVNSIAQRTCTTDTVLTVEQTMATSFADLATFGPSVTVTTGPFAWVFIHTQLENTGGGSTFAGVEVSGATSISGALNRSVNLRGAAGVRLGASTFMLFEGGLILTPGSNTFTMKYRVSSGEGTFGDRRLSVIPL